MLTGCNTVEGAGKDLQRGGAAISEEARDPFAPDCLPAHASSLRRAATKQRAHPRRVKARAVGQMI